MDENGGKMGKGSRNRTGGSARTAKKADASITSALIQEAGNKVRKNGKQIAQRLLENTLAGGVQSARLLLDLAERPVENEGEKTVAPVRSQADELADEPEWTGTMSDEDAETDAEEREPEG
jgi:hypothetical protein